MDEDGIGRIEIIITLLERGVLALERLADHFAPAGDTREKRPAVLGTATYTREEKGRKELRAAFGKQKQEPPI